MTTLYGTIAVVEVFEMGQGDIERDGGRETPWSYLNVKYTGQ